MSSVEPYLGNAVGEVIIKKEQRKQETATFAILPRLKMHCLGISKNCLETKKSNNNNQNKKIYISK